MHQPQRPRSEEFYEELENTISKVLNKDILIIQGDFNAKVGPDAYENRAGTVGQCGTGATNDRRLCLLEFVSNQRLTITNTLYPDKLKDNMACAEWENTQQNLFHLTPRHIKSSINRAKTRTYPGMDIGSDHNLVLLIMKVKLKRKFQAVQPCIRFEIED